MGSRGASGIGAKGSPTAASLRANRSQLKTLVAEYERLSGALKEATSYSPRYNAIWDDLKANKSKLSKLGITTNTLGMTGWRVDKGATTAPKGLTWVNNGESRFSGKFKQALVPTIEVDSFKFKE